MNNNFKNKVHCVYFSGDLHFEHLWISLKSLQNLNLACLGNVYLYIYEKEFFSHSQLKRLSKLKLRLIIRKCGKVFTGGEEMITTEVNAFLQIGSEIDPKDYLAKVDSDVFFVSDYVFWQVLASGKIAFGQIEDYWYPFVFFQGGCYFIKGEFLPEFKNFDKSILPLVLSLVNNEEVKKKNRYFDEYPEDATIFYFISTKTNSIMLCNFYKPLEVDIFDTHVKFSLIHFRKCRSAMIRVYRLRFVQIRNYLLKYGSIGIFLLRFLSVVKWGASKILVFCRRVYKFFV